MTYLDKLIERVRAGNISSGLTLDPVIAAVFDWSEHDELDDFVDLAYNGSVDAALALKEELLGGRWIFRDIWQLERKGVWAANLGLVAKVGNEQLTQSKSPGRALLLAILKAYKCEQEQ